MTRMCFESPNLLKAGTGQTRKGVGEIKVWEAGEQGTGSGGVWPPPASPPHKALLQLKHWARFIFAINFEEVLFLNVPGFPVINKTANQVNDSVVLVKWTAPITGQCPVYAYSVYHKEVTSTEWKRANVTKDTTHYILSLICKKDYEIGVTAWSKNGETSLKDSRLWKITTGGGNSRS